MTFDIGLLLALTLATIVLLSVERISADVVALGLLLTLTLLGLVPAGVAFAGFGSDTVIVIFGLLVLTAALLRTGVMDLAARAILRYTGTDPQRLLWVIVITSAVFGAFMSNTASTAFFIPIVFGLARRAKISPAKLLLPLAFSSILSSSVTLISTTTNVVVSGVMTQYQMPPMGMFELAPVGIPIAIVGVLYMLTLGRRLTPDRFRSDEVDGSSTALRAYLTEVVILPGSPLAGKSIEASAFGRDLDLTILRIVRNRDQQLVPRHQTVLREGDELMVEGASEEILKIKQAVGIDIKADIKLGGVSPKELGFVEAILLPRSPLVGRTLKGYGFRERTGLQVIGVNRHGETLYRKISETPLQIGDILLVQGQPERIAALERERAFRVIGAFDEERPKVKRAPLAAGIFIAVILLASFKIVSLPVATMLGVFAVFLTRCLTSEQAYREVEWRAIVLIACMLSLGAAMDHTGTDRYLAGLVVEGFGSARPLLLLSGFFALTLILTQAMSNQAAAIVVLPFAIETAVQLALNPRTFIMMIAIAASCSFLTPLEPSCLMVYGPGRYKFVDFLKVGAVLTAIIYGIAILLVPKVWPL
ncbi:MAG: SLC13 family permease [Verrucomicrobiales bacterium]